MTWLAWRQFRVEAAVALAALAIAAAIFIAIALILTAVSFLWARRYLS